MKVFSSFVVLVLCSSCFGITKEQNKVLDSIRFVESGVIPEGKIPNGDNGKAIGPFQIHYDYWKDSKVPGKYEDCHKEDYSRKVVEGWMKRYCKTSWDKCKAEVIARNHNGGKTGYRKSATKQYWLKVKKHLEKKQ